MRKSILSAVAGVTFLLGIAACSEENMILRWWRTFNCIWTMRLIRWIPARPISRCLFMLPTAGMWLTILRYIVFSFLTVHTVLLLLPKRILFLIRAIWTTSCLIKTRKQRKYMLYPHLWNTLLRLIILWRFVCTTVPVRSVWELQTVKRTNGIPRYVLLYLHLYPGIRFRMPHLWSLLSRWYAILRLLQGVWTILMIWCCLKQRPVKKP